MLGCTCAFDEKVTLWSRFNFFLILRKHRRAMCDDPTGLLSYACFWPSIRVNHPASQNVRLLKARAFFRYGSSIPTDTTMQILGKTSRQVESFFMKTAAIEALHGDPSRCALMIRFVYLSNAASGDMVAFITDTDLYITDLCVQIAVQVRPADSSRQGIIVFLFELCLHSSGQVLVTSPRMAAAVIERCVRVLAFRILIL